MIFGSPAVPTLQEMSFVDIAVRICNDPETMAFMKKYGPASFIFPSNELRAFVNKEIPESSLQMKLSLRMTEKNCILTGRNPILIGCSKVSESYNDFCFNTDTFTASNLPSTMWEEMVLKKITCLYLPYSVTNELMSIIRCVCLEIYRWKKEHEKYSFVLEISDIQKYFVWNAQGKINRLKTAKSLINKENLSVSARYKLARNYGFERDAISLWEKMSRDETDYAKRLGDRYGHKTWFEFGKRGTLEQLSQIISHLVVTPVNVRVFFSSLTPTLKVVWYKTLIKFKIMDYDDVCFCLSVLQKNEQENILREYSSEILQYYLVWPLQKEFLNVTQNVWPYMSIENYIKILNFIIFERILIGWKDFNYVCLLKEFWRQTPDNLKELARKDEIYQLILPVINCELYKRCPYEMIMEKYKGNDLEFHHVGINCNLSLKLIHVD